MNAPTTRGLALLEAKTKQKTTKTTKKTDERNKFKHYEGKTSVAFVTFSLITVIGYIRARHKSGVSVLGTNVGRELVVLQISALAFVKQKLLGASERVACSEQGSDMGGSITSEGRIRRWEPNLLRLADTTMMSLSALCFHSVLDQIGFQQGGWLVLLFFSKKGV